MVCSTSCSLLDTEPQDFVTPSEFYNNAQEVDMAIAATYAVLAEGNLYGGNLLGRMGLAADIGYESYSSDYGTVGDYDVMPSDTKVAAYWRWYYNGINRANMLMENIDKASDMSEAEKNRVRAEARFLRGFYHFMLVVRFNNIPVILHSVSDANAESVQIAQSTPRDTYLQIIADMEAAAADLPAASVLEMPGRVSQSTAYGMLSRVCLYMAGYPVKEPGMYAKAREYADKVISNGYHRLNPSFQELFLCYIQDRYDPQESLFEVEFYGNNEGAYTTTAGQVGRTNGISCSAKEIPGTGQTLIDLFGYSIGAIRATPYFLSLYETTDLRRDWTICPFSYNVNSPETGYKVALTSGDTWSRFCGKFRREYEVILPRSTNYTSINYPLLRYAEVLLNWAEAVAADPANQSAEDLARAYELVNQVRRRGYGVDIYTPNADVDLEMGDKWMLLEQIKDERPRELGFENLRKDDIVRWGEFNSRMRYIRQMVLTIPESYTSSYYANAKRYYANSEARDEFWPIPTRELGVNRKLVQNPGW
ncbi:MAG: RagB/SusD family nutrient uptake outer membrane protein [Rikenellaceae bacterium]|nr:RagB/SusD family nutrient uptake outer membrane protein [Rikenellaceae bacterium]